MAISKTLKVFLLAAIVFAPPCSFAKLPLYYLSWVEYVEGEGSYIMVQEGYLHECRPQSAVVHSSGFISGLESIQTSTDQLLLVWLELNDDMDLPIISYSLNDEGAWSSPKVLRMGSAELSSPVVARVPNEEVWLFFVSDYDELDDVYLSVLQEQGVFSNPQKIHENNLVPDIKPYVSVTEQELKVEWESYSIEIGGYQVKQRVYPFKRTESLEIRKLDLVEVTLPPGMKPVSNINLYILDRDAIADIKIPVSEVKELAKLYF